MYLAVKNTCENVRLPALGTGLGYSVHYSCRSHSFPVPSSLTQKCPLPNIDTPAILFLPLHCLTQTYLLQLVQGFDASWLAHVLVLAWPAPKSVCLGASAGDLCQPTLRFGSSYKKHQLHYEKENTRVGYKSHPPFLYAANM